MRHRTRVVVAAALSGVFVGVALYALVGRDRGALDRQVQAALVTVMGALLAAGAAYFGVVLAAETSAAAARHSADVARQEGDRNRTEQRNALFADRIRELAGKFLKAGRDGAHRAYVDMLFRDRG